MAPSNDPVWSNSALESVGEELWLAEGGMVDFYSFAYPTRMVVARLGDGRLWIWSPVELTLDLAQEVDRLGEVAHLVSPNKIHHLFLQDWHDTYPNTKLWGPSSTIAKRPDLTFEVALDDTSPTAWAGDIDQAWFRGSPLLDEIFFFHRPSRTAILADASENFSEAFLARHWKWWQRPIAKLWKITQSHGYAPLELRLSTFDRKAARRAVDKLIAWDPQRVIMAHGEWQRADGRAYLERAFAWLRPGSDHQKSV